MRLPQIGRGRLAMPSDVNETDTSFRPFLFVPARGCDSPLDIKGAGESVSVVVWAIRESGTTPWQASGTKART